MGTIKYPSDGSMYSIDLNCYFKIEVSTGRKTKITFRSFDMQMGVDYGITTLYPGYNTNLNNQEGEFSPFLSSIYLWNIDVIELMKYIKSTHLIIVVSNFSKLWGQHWCCILCRMSYMCRRLSGKTILYRSTNRIWSSCIACGLLRQWVFWKIPI